MTKQLRSPWEYLVWTVNGGALTAIALLGAVIALRPAEPHVAAQAQALSHPDASGAAAAPHAAKRKPLSPVQYHAPQLDAELFVASAYSTELIKDETMRAQVELGKRLITETYALIGPAASDPDKRYAGNELACKNCHLDAGLKAFAAPYVGITERFPTFSARSNKESTLEDRVNGCMQRSMNGKPLPNDSEEMRAIVAYMGWLGHLAPDGGKVHGQGFVKVDYPDRAVNLRQGAKVYATACVACHQQDAQGMKLPSGHGYQFPPLAGDDSYNTGAGMHRVLTAMQFIMGNMPLGASSEHPTLSVEDAFDVAGYINSLPRPEKANKEKDFPDHKLKPMSTPYPPYEDDFPVEQHKYGPFSPIYDYYVQTFDIKKSK